MPGEPYQVMPPLDDAEYEALKASIAAGYAGRAQIRRPAWRGQAGS